MAGASGPQEQILEAEYFDTADMRLIRNGVTLRRRRGGSDPGSHRSSSRGRYPAGDPGAARPRRPAGTRAATASLVRGYTRGEALRPVARISTRRQVVTLVNGAGASLAEIASDDVSAQTLGDETVILAVG